MNHIRQHVSNMVELGLAVPVGVVESVVDEPELIQLRIDIDAGHHADALNHRLGVAAPLPADQLDAVGIALVQHRIVEQHIARSGWHQVPAHVVPHQPRGNPLAAQIAIDGIVAESLAMIRKVRQRVVDLADQQVLAVSKTCHGFFHADDFTLHLRHWGALKATFA